MKQQGRILLNMLTTAALYCTRMSCCFEKVRAIPLQYLRFPTVNVGERRHCLRFNSISFVGITEPLMENLNHHGWMSLADEARESSLNEFVT